jgi:hypothetical protein
MRCFTICTPQDFIRAMKSTIRWTGHIAFVAEMKNSYTFGGVISSEETT